MNEPEPTLADLLRVQHAMLAALHEGHSQLAAFIRQAAARYPLLVEEYGAVESDTQVTAAAQSTNIEVIRGVIAVTPSAATNVQLTLGDRSIPITSGTWTPGCPLAIRLIPGAKRQLTWTGAGAGFLSLYGEEVPTDKGRY